MSTKVWALRVETRTGRATGCRYISLPTTSPEQIMHHPTRRQAAKSVLVFAAIAAATLLAGCDSTPTVIKIGVAQPMSGNLAALGQDMHNGVKLAVEELNKGGFKIKGKPVVIEIVAVDDRASAETGKQVAQQLVDA